MSRFVPKKLFFVHGVGIHKESLSSFEDALRAAGIERCNLVHVSSIVPPACKIIPSSEGLKLLSAGEITFTVLAQNQTNEPNRLVSASIGLARITGDKEQYGYLSEHYAFGETAEKSGKYSEELAAGMLAATMGAHFDPKQAWDEKEKHYKVGDHKLMSRHTCQSATGNKDGLWTSVVAAAVFILDE